MIPALPVDQLPSTSETSTPPGASSASQRSSAAAGSSIAQSTCRLSTTSYDAGVEVGRVGVDRRVVRRPRRRRDLRLGAGPGTPSPGRRRGPSTGVRRPARAAPRGCRCRSRGRRRGPGPAAAPRAAALHQASRPASVAEPVVGLVVERGCFAVPELAVVSVRQTAATSSGRRCGRRTSWSRPRAPLRISEMCMWSRCRSVWSSRPSSSAARAEVVARSRTGRRRGTCGRSR